MSVEVKDNTVSNEKICFVIMPISDPEGYSDGHFKKIYEQIFCPAIIKAGFNPRRADDDVSCNMIQAQIIKDIVNAPMALCDLSSRNPNVLFELGLRQAFDLPVVLVQEEGTPRIFDIGNFTTIDYRNQRIIDEVEEDRIKIVNGLKQTEINNKGINSIIKLLEMQKATTHDETSLTEDDKMNFMFNSILNRINELGSEINDIRRISNPNFTKKQLNQYIYEIDRLNKEKSELSKENSEINEKLKILDYRYRDLQIEKEKFRDGINN